jgi:hypothetical protein
MFCGAEERALWSAAAARALGRLVPRAGKEPHPPELRAVVMEHVEAYADMTVAAFRKRDGSRP